MNKQQALEAILRKVRGWEEPEREVRATPERQVRTDLQKELEWFTRRDKPGIDEQDREHLISIGAAALYLLVDEVAVVEGRTLEEWLASTEDQRLAMFARGEARVVVEVQRLALPAGEKGMG